MMHCAGCERPILDRFLLNVLDRAWHVHCVQCTDCQCTLNDKCFSREGKLYCRTDFFRRFGTKCAECGHGISPNDLVRKAQSKVFHLKCFTCMLCRKQLSTGEELYVVGENKFLCKTDYLQNKPEGSDIEDENMDFESTIDSQDGLTEKDLFCDVKPDIDNKNNENVNENSKSDTLLNNNHYHQTLTADYTSPIKLEPRLTDSLSLKMDNHNMLGGTLPPTPPSPEMNNSTTPGSDESVDINDNISCGDENDNDDVKDSNGNPTVSGSKRRGPRTTIKAKQLEILKAAFNATPKPTRHIREQLSQETGLTMRVIQVWFQNRRSKERRMKQLSAMGARRHFYRSPRRMRAIRGDMDEEDMLGQGYGYFNENEPEMYPGFQGFNNYFPGQGPEGPGNMNFLVNDPRGTPPHMDPRVAQMGPDSGTYLSPDILPPPAHSPSSIPLHSEDSYLSNVQSRPMDPQFTTMPLHHRPDMTSEVW